MRIHSPQITGSAANTNIVLTTVTSSISVLSSSFAATASSADNLTVRGTLTAQTINVQTITSSIDYVTGSSINGSLLANTHQFTGSVSVTGSLQVNESNVILTNQTSSMSVATASYWSGSIINAATASYVENAQSASYVLNAVSASRAISSSRADSATTASYVLQAQSASYWSGSIINAATASYVENAQSASYVLQAQSASYWSGSIINAATASYVLNAVSASFALTASYISGSGAGVGFPFSGSAIITGSLFVSGSTISGSFKGDGSQITGLTAGGKIHTQTSAASTWTVSHNLGVQYPNVTVYDNNNNVIIPQTIVATDANTLTLTFGSAVAGYAVAGIGGIINVQGRTTQQYFTASTTWSFAHNLGDKYVSLQAFDDAFEMMIPTTIRLVDFTSSLLLFDSASSGYAVATIGGDLPAISSSYAGYTLQVANSAPYSASWVAIPNVTVTNAVSSSFAATASSADNLTVRGTLTAQTINVQTITSSIDFVTGSSKFGSLSTNTHQFTGSVGITGSAAALLNINNGVLYVSASGNVGIGTSSPTTTLTVNGPITVLAGNNIYLTNTKLGGDASYNFDINYNTGGTPSLTWYGGTTTSKFAVNSTGAATYASSITAASPDNYSGDALKLTTKAGPTSYYMNIYPTDAGAGGITWTFAQKVGSTIYDNVMVMRLGNLLIGTTTSGVLASANGISLMAGGMIYINSDNASIFNRSTNSNGTVIQFRYNEAVVVGTIAVTSTTTAYNTSSDYRLKEDLKQINGLEKVSAINVYNYKWKSSNDRMDGVLAHELQEVIPYAVTGEKDGEDMQGVDYSKLVPVLVKSIQELSAKNTTLEERLTALENK